MSDIFASAKSVLRRANHHIADLETAIKTTAPRQPYAYSTELDSQTGHYLHVLTFSESFSDDTSCILFDAINNLRASLDQMTFAVAHRHRGGNKIAYFPFAKDLVHWPNKINGLKNDLPPQVRTLFETFKPYKGGCNTLWALNELANTKKHAILSPVSFGQAKITYHEPNMPPITWAPPAIGSEAKIIFYRSIDPPNRHPNIEIAYGIVIEHPEPILQSQPPIALLNAMSGIVQNILMATEAECRII